MIVRSWNPSHNRHMAITRFTRQEFESALPLHKSTGQPLWESLGLAQGEYVYRAGPIIPGVFVRIRSSVRDDGYAASTGKDSIRLWLVNDKGESLGCKLSKYVTRVSGWDIRLVEQLRELWKIGRKLVPCGCGAPVRLAKVKKDGPNKGRMFVACSNRESHGNKVFEWL